VKSKHVLANVSSDASHGVLHAQMLVGRKVLHNELQNQPLNRFDFRCISSTHPLSVILHPWDVVELVFHRNVAGFISWYVQKTGITGTKTNERVDYIPY